MNFRQVNSIVSTAKIAGAIIGVFVVDKLHDRGGIDKRVLVISTIEVGYFKIKKHKLIRSRVFLWSKLKSYSKDDKYIKLEFPEENVLHFKSEEQIEEISAKIERLMTTIYTSSEIENKEMFSGLMENPKISNSFGEFQRFLSIIYDTSITPDGELTESIKHTLDKEEKVICFDKIDDADNAINIFLNFFENTSKYDEFILNTNSSNHVLKKTAKFFKKGLGNNIKHLYLDGVVGVYLEKFLNSAGSYMNGQLRSLTFANSKFGKDSLEVVANYVRDHDVFSLTFDDSLNKDTSAEDLTDAILSKSVTSNIQLLSFCSIPSFPFMYVYKKFNKLTALSLCNCDVDVIVGINTCASNLPRLRELDLSSNPCYGSLSAIIPTLGNLVRIDACDVDYEKRGFKALIEGLFTASSNYQFYLSLRDTTPNEEESWEQYMETFKTFSGSRLSGLDWSSQPITKDLIDFIGRCNNLETLIINGAIIDDESLVPLLFEKLSQLSSLHTLDISNLQAKNGQHCNIIPFLKAFTSMTNLRWIDLKGNNIGNEGLLSLKPMLSFIDTIGIDHNGVTRLDVYTEFIDGINRENPINIEWPAHDIEHTCSLPEDVQLLKFKFRRLRKIPNDWTSKIEETDQKKGQSWEYSVDSPLYILNTVNEEFHVSYDYSFPRYFTHDVENLANEKVGADISKSSATHNDHLLNERSSEYSESTDKLSPYESSLLVPIEEQNIPDHINEMIFIPK